MMVEDVIETQEEALRAYARMINTGELGHLAPSFGREHATCPHSQKVLGALQSKDEFLAYMGTSFKP